MMHIMNFNLWHRFQKPTSKQRSTSCFIIIYITTKLVTLNFRMNSANKAICYAEVFSSWVVQLNPSTQHTAMVHTMHTGTSTQNVYFLLVERSELVRK